MKIYAQGTILADLPFKIPLKPQTLSKPEKIVKQVFLIIVLKYVGQMKQENWW